MNRFYEAAQLTDVYHQYRPNYTQEVAKVTMEFYASQQSHCNVPEKLDLMLDVGCGSGQASRIFQSYFHRIIASDISTEQIKTAQKHNTYHHITFVEASAENLPASDNSVDLIVCAEAAHWIDLPKFFAECERVLKPTGCLAIIGYYMPTLIPLIDVDDGLFIAGTEMMENMLLRPAFENPGQAKPWLNAKHKYESIFKAMPFENKRRIDDLQVTYDWSLNDARGVMYSMDTCYLDHQKRVNELKKTKTEVTKADESSVCFAETFCSLLKDLWKIEDTNDDQTIMKAQYDFFMLLAKP